MQETKSWLIMGFSGIDEESKNEKFLDLVKKEYDNPENQFHEKSQLRECLNRYMTLFIKTKQWDLEKYNEFYWLNYKTLLDYKTLKNVKHKKNEKKDEEKNKKSKCDSIIAAYDEVLGYQKFKIYDKSHCKNISDYFEANTDNTIELDTYITHPDHRGNGLAEILTFEGIKKSLAEIDKKHKNVYIASTLHEKNFVSKYVSEFFGLEDYIFLNRRNGRDRQVHILKIEREQIPQYLERIEKKLAVIYKYNPNGINVEDKEAKEIREEDGKRRQLMKEQIEKYYSSEDRDL